MGNKINKLLKGSELANVLRDVDIIVSKKLFMDVLKEKQANEKPEGRLTDFEKGLLSYINLLKKKNTDFFHKFGEVEPKGAFNHNIAFHLLLFNFCTRLNLYYKDRIIAFRQGFIGVSYPGKSTVPNLYFLDMKNGENKTPISLH